MYNTRINLLRRLFELLRVAAILFAIAVLQSSAFARVVDIRILHTANLRAQLEPIGFGRLAGAGGLLKCSQIITEMKGAGQNTVLIGYGSNFFGSPISDILSAEPIIAAVNHVGYDFIVPSGTDFSRGVETLQDIGERIHGTLLGANVGGLGGRDPLAVINPFAVIDIQGVKVAFIGATASQLPQYCHQSLLDGIEIVDVLDSLKNVIISLRRHEPDLTVLVVDQSFVDVGTMNHLPERISSLFPEIDLLLASSVGFSLESAEIGDLLFAQAGERGSSLGVVEIGFDTVSRSISSKRSYLVPVDSTSAEDTDLRATLSLFLDEAERRLNEHVGTAEQRLPAFSRNNLSSVTALLLRAVQEGTGADVVLMSRQNNQIVYPRPLRERDLWRILPNEDQIVVLSMTPADIRALLSANMQYLGRNIFLSSLGICYSADENADGSLKSGEVRLSDGSQIHPRRHLQVAMPASTLASLGGRFSVARELAARPEASAVLARSSVRDMVRNYLARHNPLPIKLNEGVIQHLNLEVSGDTEK